MATTAEQVAALQQQNNQMYIQSAREQMAFQERMSNSAHSREIKDLINAGLNPVLSATGGQGATTPNGAQADVDTSSMVNYLLNEMNNENARQINSAQVAAQRYAADMALRAAQTTANAQIRIAEINATHNGLGAIITALSNSNSPAGKAMNTLLGFLGMNYNSSTGTISTPGGIISSKNENNAIKFIKSVINGGNGYMSGQAFPNWLRSNYKDLVSLFNQAGAHRVSNWLLNYYTNSSAK